jgi:hypothetical protein
MGIFDSINLRYFMTNTKLFYLICFLIFCFVIPTKAQESGKKEEKHHEQETDQHVSHHKKHALSASINHTIIFSGVKNGETQTSVFVPSFGLNYTYFFNNKWALGLHNDIILEDFLVKGESSGDPVAKSSDEEITVIERGRPVSMAIMGIYKPIQNLGIMAGAGMEFSSHEDYAVIRFGLEAPVHLGQTWEIYGTITYDIMIDAYTSLTYGIGLVILF